MYSAPTKMDTLFGRNYSIEKALRPLSGPQNCVANLGCTELNAVQGSQRLPKPLVAPEADGLPSLESCRMTTDRCG